MDYSGKEVVQVYYSAPAGNLEKPYQELAAFGKTDLLKPGQAQELSISFATSSMTSYSEKKAAWMMEKGEYIIRLGNSSRNTKIEAILSLSDDVIIEQVKNLFGDSDPVKGISRENVKAYSCEGENDEKDLAVRLELDSNKFKSNQIEYQEKFKEFPKYKVKEKLTATDVKSGKASLEDLVSQLTVEEMATVCTGTSRLGDGGGGTISSWLGSSLGSRICW